MHTENHTLRHIHIQRVRHTHRDTDTHTMRDTVTDCFICLLLLSCCKLHSRHRIHTHCMFMKPVSILSVIKTRMLSSIIRSYPALMTDKREGLDYQQFINSCLLKSTFSSRLMPEGGSR